MTTCQREYLDATSGRALLGRFVPTCSADGSYAPMQCHGSTGYCWCVTKDGQEIAETKIRGHPKCKYFQIISGPMSDLIPKEHSGLNSSEDSRRLPEDFQS